MYFVLHNLYLQSQNINDQFKSFDITYSCKKKFENQNIYF
jgi:hypothetical protein